MVKSRSSASSATRKKHAQKQAKKHADPDAPPELPPSQKPNEKKKGKKPTRQEKESRQKIYVAPVKPKPAQPDPLDTAGLAYQLPPELVISLRNLGKKALETKTRGLEELQELWVNKVLKGENPENEYILVDILPVWLHHLPSLFIHPSRRVRLLTASLHDAFLQVPSVKTQIVFSLTESLDEDQIASIVGVWCIAVHDVDRVVAVAAGESWKKLLQSLPNEKLAEIIQSLQSFVQRASLDPNGTYVYLNPPPPVAPPQPPSKKNAPGSRLHVSRSDTPDGESRSRSEVDEETEQDRVARIRVGALGAIRWLVENHPPSSFLFFSNPALWSSLHHAERCPLWDGGSSFGFGQPYVRRAGWMLLQSLLSALKGHPEQQQSLLPVLSQAVLRSSWVEPDPGTQQTMLRPLLLFLKEFPQAWKIETQVEPDSDSDAEEDEREDGEDDTKPVKSKSVEQRPSVAYAEFLQFLQLGCGGSPIQGYPTIVIVLSTIPSEILTSTSTPSSSTHTLDDFFTSFWGAIDGRALSGLQRLEASAQFLGALLECLVFLARRFWKGTETEFVHTLVKGQLERVWTELVAGTLQIKPKIAGEQICKTLGELKRVDEGLWRTAWDVQSTSIKDNAIRAPLLVCNALSAFMAGGGTIQEVGRELMQDVANTTLDGYQASLGASKEEVKSHTEFFVSAFEILDKELLADPSFAERVGNLATQNAYTLLTSLESRPFLLTYLSSPIVEPGKQRNCWQHLLSEISNHLDPKTLSSDMSKLLDVLEKEEKLRVLRPKADELDSVIGRMLVDALGGGGNAALLSRVLRNPEPILSEQGTRSLSRSLSSSFALQLDSALHDENVSVASFEVVLDLLAIVLQRERDGSYGVVSAADVLPNIFVFAPLLPKCYETETETSSAFMIAERIWEEWKKNAGDEKEAVDTEVKQKLRNLLGDVSCRVLPEHIVQALQHLEPSLRQPLSDIIPSENELNEMLEELPSDPIHASLTVLEPLIPPASMFLEESYTPQPFDSQGHSLYARLVTALIHLVVADRQIARRNLWIMRHLLTFSVYAEDLINVPSGKSPIFERQAIEFGTGLGELVVKVHQVVAYVLVTSGDETARALASLSGQSKEELTGLAWFIAETVGDSKRTETIREFRVLSRVLQHVFDDVEKEEAERWATFARGIERAAPNTALAILSSINAFGSEPPRLERYRNELAANITGVRPSNAETEGLALLRKLAAVAPPVESDVVFLPQQRAVNLIKTCQQWVSSDDGDVGEEVEREMTLIFTYLAPILQHVAGSHWAFVFDVIENNLENSSISEDDTLVTLARTLKLIILIQDLAATNKALRAEWQEREGAVLKAVRDLATSQLDSDVPSAPTSACRELVLSIVQNLPENLIDHQSLPKMCHLLLDPSVDVQKMAYKLLRQAARKHTEHLVIEAGVDTEDKFKAELPRELLVMFQQQGGDFDPEEVEQEQNIFGYLLGWMLLFDLFEDTSLKVRSGYIEQLRALDIIPLNFIPTVFSILRLDRGILKAFKLDVWDVKDFYVSHYEPGESFSLPVFAAHLYYRSLLTIPSVFFGWISDCKDIQFADAVGSYTSTHFSPVLIEAELENVKGASELSGDENLAVKVAKNVAEVSAAYSVDEHQIEIRVRIPSDWPLHRIEVKDANPVGVDERRWRAWRLAVQQTLWAHNGGRIVDGLALFKKNVTLHFEGQVECAICYSIISPMDGKLPEKPCKTCKNEFHGLCLYKWFQSSHSSSCPLCRSDILH